MNALIASHSGLRYIVLLTLIIAVVNAVANLKSGKYTKKDKLINLIALITVHLQLLLGLIVYFLSPKVQFNSGTMKNEIIRFFTMEHALMMIIAIILVTVGRRKAEKQEDLKKRHKTILVYYLIALLLIVVAIPWPFMRPSLGAGYF